MTTIFLTTTGSGTWTVPSDWNNSANSIEVIGGGGGSSANVLGVSYGAPGGGGAYSKITNLSLTPSASITIQVGARGTNITGGGTGGVGGDTWFNGASLAASSVGAKGGSGGADGVPATGGAGGAAASGIGTTKFSGGNGAPNPSGNSAGGGGGAAGPNGNGGNGGIGFTAADAGGGGGGSGGGSNGGANSGNTGGTGGNNSGGTGGGAGGTSVPTNGAAGTNGGGGGGGGATSGLNAGSGGNGGAGTEWDATHGSGGGGGTAGNDLAQSATGGSGGLYGAAGGIGVGGADGLSAQGIIVIIYTPSGAGVTADVAWTEIQDSFAASVTSSTVIAANDAAWLSSPCTWDIQSGAATSQVPGAYRSILATSTTFALTFDVSLMDATPSQIWWRVDYSIWTKATLAASITCTVPADTLARANVPYHLIEFMIKSTLSTGNRWDPSHNTNVFVKHTGLVIGGAGASVSAPIAENFSILAFGDSLFEGGLTVSETGTDTNDEDAQMSMSFLMRRYLGCEFANRGFSAQGLTQAGAGSVPTLINSYNLLYTGVSLTFPAGLTAVLLEVSINDSGSSLGPYTTAATTFLNAIIAAAPANIPIFILSAAQSAAPSFLNAGMQAAIAAVANSRLKYIDITGFFNTTFGASADNVHPSGPNNQAKISPQIANAIRPYLLGGTAGMLFIPNMDGT